MPATPKRKRGTAIKKERDDDDDANAFTGRVTAKELAGLGAGLDDEDFEESPGKRARRAASKSVNYRTTSDSEDENETDMAATRAGHPADAINDEAQHVKAEEEDEAAENLA